MRKLSFAILLFLFASIALADTTLRGTVRDAAGQRVAGATVRAVGPIERAESTNTAGEFVFAALPEGTYTLSVDATAMATWRREVTLRGNAMDLDVVLDVAAVTSALTVVADVSPETRRVAGGTAVVLERDIQESRAQNLEDVLAFVPGVVVQSRYGSDESQISIRGSGLRNNFHLRGLNLLVNGIPYQDADGFSDFESLDLAATERIQVWKGANALQYGGSAMGGAVNLVTYDGATADPITVRLDGGSFGLFRGQIAGGTSRDAISLFGSASRTQFDGFREYSEQERTRVFANLDWRFRPASTFRFDGIFADVSEHLPGALTRTEFETDPDAADPTNARDLWGRFYDYTRLAAQALHVIGTNQEIGGYVFGQRRSMVHPIFQVLVQDADNAGAETNYRLRSAIAGRPNRFVAGVTYLNGANDEQRYVNVLGERGSLVVNHKARATTWAAYAENQFEITPALTLSAGGRFDSSRRTLDDRILADGDRSDTRTFQAFSPRLGILFGSGASQWFANVSRSYEPPLLLELLSFGSPGFLDLDAQSTWQYEVGTRGTHNLLQWELSLYQADIDDEIVNINVRPFPNAPFTIPSYRSVANTRHRGVEAGLSGTAARDLVRAGDALRFRAAYTMSDFRFVDDPDYGDNDLPGAPRHLLRGETRYDAGSWWIAPQVDWSPAEFYADSANTQRADPYAVFNIRGGFRWQAVELFGELSNVTDELYSASVQVDSAVGRTFEPGAPRSVSIGVRWSGGSR